MEYVKIDCEWLFELKKHRHKDHSMFRNPAKKEIAEVMKKDGAGRFCLDYKTGDLFLWTPTLLHFEALDYLHDIHILSYKYNLSNVMDTLSHCFLGVCEYRSGKLVLTSADTIYYNTTVFAQSPNNTEIIVAVLEKHSKKIEKWFGKVDLEIIKNLG